MRAYSLYPTDASSSSSKTEQILAAAQPSGPQLVKMIERLDACRKDLPPRTAMEPPERFVRYGTER